MAQDLRSAVTVLEAALGGVTPLVGALAAKAHHTVTGAARVLAPAAAHSAAEAGRRLNAAVTACGEAITLAIQREISALYGAIPNFAAVAGGPHRVARTRVHQELAMVVAEQNPGSAPLTRAAVAADLVSWNVDFPDYRPVEVDLPRGSTRFAKPDDHPDTDLSGPFHSFEGALTFDAGRPRNPAGRTGLAGRGYLNHWGANFAADCILTRDNPLTGKLEVLVVGRGDQVGQPTEWAFPGGKVDPGESASETAGRELLEETGVSGFQLDLSNAVPVFQGYVDDWRNTDNAWMETTAFHRHLTADEASAIVTPTGPQLGVSTDEQAPEIAKVTWVELTDALDERMYASHRQLLQLAVARLRDAPS
ncbi:MAG TPA: NUDIX domain-containing protein [Jiangellaceae bacterium]